MRPFYILLIPLLFVGNNVLAQEADLSAKIDRYYSLSDEKQYDQSGKMAFEIGHIYLELDQNDFAKKFFEFAINDSERTNNHELQSQSYYFAGLATFRYAESIRDNAKKNDQYDEAKSFFKKAVAHYSGSDLKQSERHILAFYYGGICHYKLDEYKVAIEPLSKALRFAQKEKMNEIAMESARLLSKIFATMDEPASADYYQSIYQSYIEYSTAVDSLQVSKQANQQLNETIEQKETELTERNLALENARLEAEKSALMIRQKQDQILYLGIGSGVILVLLIFIFRAYRFTKKAKRELEAKNTEILKQKQLVEDRQKALEKEKAKSERLLLNILPRPVALELREHGRTRPLFYKQVTVVFTDLKGFTRFAEKMSAEEIVKELDICFHAFDNIVEKHNLEKIKTMGDGYLCAGGVPKVNKSNPYDAIKAAMEMMKFMQDRREKKRREGKDYFELRIGIHTGPVVAGVVGKKKFAYDIWGDTVNVASRMESSGEAGKINISGDTFAYVKDQFFFTHRGKIKAKNKGEIDMFFVDGRVKYAVKN